MYFFYKIINIIAPLQCANKCTSDNAAVEIFIGYFKIIYSRNTKPNHYGIY